MDVHYQEHVWMSIEIFMVICARYTVQENAKNGKYIAKVQIILYILFDLVPDHFTYFL